METEKWSIQDLSAVHNRACWIVFRGKKPVGRILQGQSKFSADWGPENSYDYLGHFDSLPEALRAIKDMWELIS